MPPFLRWTHRFARPNGTPFRLSFADRLRNYLIGCDELGLATAPVLDHFRQLVGDTVVDGVVARWEAEKALPRLASRAASGPATAVSSPASGRFDGRLIRT